MSQPAQESASSGSQEVDMPRPNQGYNSWEAHMSQPAQELDLQEVVMLQPARGSAP